VLSQLSFINQYQKYDMNKSKVYKLFSNNFVTDGAKWLSIIDVQRENIFLIPAVFFKIIVNKNNESINNIMSLYNSESERENILKLFNYLDENELLNFNNNFEQFPSISRDWDFPSHITNCIIEFSSDNICYFRDLIFSLDELLCQYIEVRVFEPFDISKLISFLNLFEETTITSIDLKIELKNPDHLAEIIKIKQNQRIISISVYTQMELDFFNYSEEINIIYSTLQRKSCGKISEDYFAPNLNNFLESLKHNSCLNRKVSIDTEGNIKNCPSMKESFGNIKDTTLAEAIEKPGFKKYWDINKDKILVCKDCEFRYICTDCRAYVEDPEDILSKPLKCGYNPYTGEWSEWSTNPLKQKAIDFYGMREMVTESKDS